MNLEKRKQDRRENVLEKIKTIQRNNPKKIQWIVGGLIGWSITITLVIIRLVSH